MSAKAGRGRLAVAMAVALLLAVTGIISTSGAGPAEAATTGSVSGVVREGSATGAGLCGLTVYLGDLTSYPSANGLPLPASASSYRSATTGADGRYTFSNVPFISAGYSVSVAPPADGRFAAPLTVSPVKPQPMTPDVVVDVVLDQVPGTLTGRAISTQGGATIPGAVVIAEGPVRLYATAASDGSYVIRGLRAGTYQVTASAPHFGYGSPTSATLAVGQTVGGADVSINRLSVVSGTVTTAGVQPVPVPGIVASLNGQGLATPYTAVTDAAGRYSIPDVAQRNGLSVSFTDPNGRYTSATGGRTFDIVPGVDVTGIDARLTVPSTVTGTLTAADGESTPIPNAAISIGNRSTVTDFRGEYVLEGVIAGGYSAYISLPSDSPYFIHDQYVVVTGETSSQRFDFQADVKSGVSGTITVPGPRGSTPATVEVTLATRHFNDDGCCSYDTAAVQTVVVDSSGRASYRFPAVSPDQSNHTTPNEGTSETGRYLVSARVVSGGSGEYLTTWWQDATTRQAGNEFEVPLNQADVDIDVTVKRPVSFVSAPVPTISGTPTVGATLTAKPGTWSPDAERAWSWSADGVAIPGATSFKFVVTDAVIGKRLTATAVGTRFGYETTSRTSAPTAPVVKSVVAGTVAVTGEAVIGSTLTVNRGTWSPATVTLATQWLRDGSAIADATATTYRLTAADVGHVVTARVSGSLAGYQTAVATSAAGPKVKDVFKQVTRPTISGTAAVGRVLTLSTGSWTPSPASFVIHWLRDGEQIAGARSTTYTITEADFGHRLSATVAPVKSGFVQKERNATVTSTVVRLLTATPTPAIVGAAVVGTTLVASVQAWGPSPVALKFQWYRNGTAVPGATGSAHTLTSTDAGARLTVSVTGSKSGYVPVTRTSSASGTVRSAAGG